MVDTDKQVSHQRSLHTRPARPADLRRHNLALLTRLVSERESLTRAELSRMTRLTKGTVSSLVEELIEREILVESAAATAPGQPGRPPSGVLALNGESHCGIGVEINIDYIAVSVADLLRRVRFRRVEIRDNRKPSKSAVLGRAARLVGDAIAAATGFGLRPAGVAMAIPGPVDLERGVLMRAPGLAWSDVAVVTELRRRLERPDLPIFAENQANLAALGELWLGLGAEAGDYVHVSGESGIGGGIIVDGALFRGARGFAGEIGHIVVDPQGPVCTCGGRGCLGRVAGKEVLFELAGLQPDTATQLGGNPLVLQELLAMLERHDPRATHAVDHVAQALGLALADIVNMIDPDTIVLGGIFAPLSPWLIEPLSATLSRQAILGAKTPVSVRASQVGPDAAVRGAATWVVQSLLAGELSPPAAPKPRSGSRPIKAAA